jgi:hypothetical protein
LTNEDLSATSHPAWPSAEEVKEQCACLAFWWLTAWEHLLLVPFWCP